MKHAVPRHDPGPSLDQARKLLPKKLARIVEWLDKGPTDAMLAGIEDQAADAGAFTTWFAPGSVLLLECTRIRAEAHLAYATLTSAEPGSDVTVSIDNRTFTILRQDRVETEDVTKWVKAWCSALTARDAATLDGLAAVPESLQRRAPVQVDEYYYAWKRALVLARIDDPNCAPAIEETRVLWQKRKIAQADAAKLDAIAIDVLDALVQQDAATFNDKLFEGLRAHAKFWSGSRKVHVAEGWVALTFLALACVAHDRGIPIDVESDYLPKALITREFTSDVSLRTFAAADKASLETSSSPGPTPSATKSQADSSATTRATQLRQEAASATREIALLAGEGFARTRLEPQGFRRVPVERTPTASFDYVYVKDPDEVTLIDTLAGDEQLLSLRTPAGAILEQGTLGYVLAVVENLRREHPDLAEKILTALNGGKLRYYEARYPIDQAGKLGEIEVRQYAL